MRRRGDGVSPPKKKKKKKKKIRCTYRTGAFTRLVRVFLRALLVSALKLGNVEHIPEIERGGRKRSATNAKGACNGDLVQASVVLIATVDHKWPSHIFRPIVLFVQPNLLVGWAIARVWIEEFRLLLCSVLFFFF